jgi:hypothetical protein
MDNWCNLNIDYYLPGIKTINMKSILFVISLFCLAAPQSDYGQNSSLNSNKFFKDTSVLNATLVANMGKIYNYHGKTDIDYPAIFKTTLPDGTEVDDKIMLNIRGHFRLGFCYVPPIKLIFNSHENSKMYSLKDLKLVNECKISNEFEQYLLKEYVIYKIYNLITNLSFQVRLLKLNLQDSTGKKKMMTEYAFLLEDIKAVAKRNSCKDLKNVKLQTEATDRQQMTIVAIFEYMIGNTDWAVSVNHNTKLVKSIDDSLARPFVIPYDFDYSGLVNTSYAVPDERLNIENVRQRLYRGFPRSLTEIEEAVAIFRLQKDKIYALINNFDLLTRASKTDMTQYLDEFYTIINDPRSLKRTFVDNARNQ